MSLIEFIYVSLATYYLAVAFVDVVMQIAGWNSSGEPANYWRLLKWTYRKPFNCVLCMSFYFSILLVILVQNISITFILIPAVAGVALILSKIHQRLETFI